MSNMTFSMNPGRSVSVSNGCCVSSEELKTLLTLVLVASISVSPQPSYDWLPESTSHQGDPAGKGMAQSMVST